MMKTSKMMLLAATALLAGCSNENELSQVANGNLTVTATMEEATSSSRVGFDATSGALFWTAGDAISVYTTNSNWGTLTLQGDGGAAAGTFNGTLTGDNPQTSQFAVYPSVLNPAVSDNTLSVTLPTSYTYTKEDADFGTAAGVSTNAPMLAQIATDGATSFSFKHLGGVFCFKIANIPAGADKFEFSVNKAITGSHAVDLSDTDKPLIKTATEDNVTATTDNVVSISFTANETATSTRVFYVPVPTGTYGQFTWKIYDGTEEKSSFTSSETASNTVGRGSLVKMPTFTCVSASGAITTEVADATALSTALSSGQSVSLTAEVTLTGDLTVSNDAVIDLNGQSLTAGTSTINVSEGKTLTITNSSAAAASYALGRAETAVAGSLTGSGDIIKAAANSTITIGEGVTMTSTGANSCCVFVPNGANGVTVNTAGDLLVTQAGAATIYVNGNVTSGTINVTGGSVKHSSDVAIYIAGVADLTISGDAVVEGTTGVEIRAGKLTVNGGTITATAEEFTATPNGNGSTSVGAAVAVTQHSTNQNLNATITGGTFTGVKALYEEDTVDDNVTGISMSVSGGTFNGAITSENCPAFITSGTFTDASAFDYLVDNANVKVGADLTLEKAITVSKDNVVIDLNEKSITAAACDAFEVTGSLTIKGTETSVVNAGIVSEGVTVGSVCAVWANGGTVTIEGGYYKVGPDSNSDRNDCIYAGSTSTSKGGTITINGGKFEYTGTPSDENGKDGDQFLINCADNTEATITVNGGTFKNHVPGCEPVAPEGKTEVSLGTDKKVYNASDEEVTVAHTGTETAWYTVK